MSSPFIVLCAILIEISQYIKVQENGLRTYNIELTFKAHIKVIFSVLS